MKCHDISGETISGIRHRNKSQLWRASQTKSCKWISVGGEWVSGESLQKAKGQLRRGDCWLLGAMNEVVAGTCNVGFEVHNRYFWAKEYIFFSPGGLLPGKGISWINEADTSNESDKSFRKFAVFSSIFWTTSIAEDFFLDHSTVLVSCLSTTGNDNAYITWHLLHTVYYNLLRSILAWYMTQSPSFQS